MTENNGFIFKRKIENLRDGELFSVTVKDLANFYAGGELKVSNGDRTSPYSRLSKHEKISYTSRAYRDLILLLRNPPDNIHAEELAGSHFGVSFLKLENGGMD